MRKPVRVILWREPSNIFYGYTTFLKFSIKKIPFLISFLSQGYFVDII